MELGEYILQKLVTIILTYKSDHGRVSERIIVGYSIEGETGIIYSTEPGCKVGLYTLTGV